jgi:DNA-binding NtrC family response regulator
MQTNKQLKTILLVDDEQENLRTYTEILSDMDYNVLASADSEAALDLLRKNEAIDLVITDFRMPGRNGLEFVSLLRREKFMIPVIMLTAHGNIETYLSSISLGVFEYVNKPVRKEEFERVVRHALHDVRTKQTAAESRV